MHVHVCVCAVLSVLLIMRFSFGRYSAAALSEDQYDKLTRGDIFNATVCVTLYHNQTFLIIISL